jgi:hypothetical protein
MAQGCVLNQVFPVFLQEEIKVRRMEDWER